MDENLNKIFRTYCKGSGKKCLEKHKNIDHIHTFDEVREMTSFGGILQRGFIDISFDDVEMSEKFYDIAETMNWRCMVLENPDTRHIHTFWKIPDGWTYKDGKDKKLACGLIADIHSGDTYVPLRVSGISRFPPTYDILKDEDYQEIPAALYPVSTAVKLWQMREGDGRNETLFAYILTLQKQLKLSPDEIRILYRDIINPYILAEPVPQNELEVILRDEAFKQDDTADLYDERGRINHEALGDYIIDHYHVISSGGDKPYLMIYRDGVYVSSRQAIINVAINTCKNTTIHLRNETYAYMLSKAPVKQVDDPKYIAFANGILDIETGEMSEYTPERVITNRIPWDYNPDAFSEVGNKTLDNVTDGDHEIRALLEECVGSCFYRSAHLAGGAAFIFSGDGANGKSTILDWMRAAIGRSNISSLELSEIGERFGAANLQGKTANIGDDISDDFLEGKNVSVFRKVVTGNTISAEFKGENRFEFEPYATLIFSANTIPRISDQTNAVIRRLKIVPFNHTFRKSDPDHNDFLLRDLTQKDCIEYLIRLGVEGLRRVLAHGYTESRKVDQQVDEFNRENNPLLGFIDDYGGDTAFLGKSTNEIYLAYEEYCGTSGIHAVTKAKLTRQLNKALGLTQAKQKNNGRTVRIFIKE